MVRKKIWWLMVMVISLQISIFSMNIDDNLIKSLQHKKEVKTWIFFADKNINDIDKLDKSFLSDRAIKRRQIKCKIDVSFYDLPVKKEYIDSLSINGIKIIHISRWLNAVSCYLDNEKLGKISQYSFIKEIKKVAMFKRNPVKMSKVSNAKHKDDFYGNSYGQLAQIHVPELHNLGYSGQGILVGVFDAGFNNLEHEALSGLDIIDTYDFVNNDNNVDDENDAGNGDHGTMTLSSLAGYSPGELIGPAYSASFLLAKTENTEIESHTEEDNWVAAAEWAEAQGVDVISTSLGYRYDFDDGSDYSYSDMDGDTAPITIAADIAASMGIVVVVSAGNSGSDTGTIGAPADGDSVFTIGAVKNNGDIAYFSSRGPTYDGRIKPDFMAQGVDVYVASPNDASGYTSADGTSFSCPLSAGAITALLSADNSLTPMEIREILRQTSDNANNPNNNYGWGIINIFEAYRHLFPIISFIPLSDTENMLDPIEINATISSNFNNLDMDSTGVFYKFNNDDTYSFIPFSNISNDDYHMFIPNPNTVSDCSYYIMAKTINGRKSFFPSNAPDSVLTFHIGQDNIPPTIEFEPFINLSPYVFPLEIRAKVSDNIGVSEVNFLYKINSSTENAYQLTYNDENGYYEGSLDIDVTIDDIIEYRIEAKDVSENENVSYLPENGYYQNTIQDIPIYIWEPDPTPISGDVIKQILDQKGIPYDYGANLPTDLNLYSVCFVLLGMFSNNFVIETGDTNETKLVNFLENGGNVYLEGGDFFCWNKPDNLIPYFSYDVSGSDGTDDLEGITGVENTFVSGMAFDYNGENNYVDVISSVGNGIQLFKNADNSKGCGIAFDGGSFKTIGASFEFGGLVDNETSSKSVLLSKYLQFFGLTTDINDDSMPIQWYKFYPNPFNPNVNISFSLTKSENVSVKIFNINGQLVKTILNSKVLDKGVHHYQWNAEMEATGIYLLLIKSSGKVIKNKLLLLK